MFRKLSYLFILIIINYNLSLADQFQDTTISDHHFFYNIDLSFFKVFSNQKKIFFTNDASSSVFTIKNDTLKEYGWTEKHYGLQHSSFVVIDTTLYSYGGYGFWRDNNTLRFFDISKGWIPIIIENGNPLEFAHSSHMIYTDSLLYIFCGKSIDLLNPLISVDNKNLLIIDISKRHCKTTSLKFPINAENVITSDHSGVIFENEGNYILYKIKNDRYYKLLKNETFYDKTGQNWSLKGDSLVFDNGNNYAIHKMFKVEPIHKVGWVQIILAIIIITSLYFLFKIFVKTEIKENKLTYDMGFLQLGKEKYLLSDDAQIVLAQIMMRKVLNGIELGEILDTGHMSNSNLLKKRRDVIVEINKKSMDLCGVSVISIDQDLSDKRQRLYTLNEEIIIVNNVAIN